MLSALHAGHALPQKDLLVDISVRGRVNPRAMVWLEGLGKLEKFKDHIRTRTRNLPACSIVPQSSTLLHTSVIFSKICVQ
jgi:hypothetical protein